MSENGVKCSTTISKNLLFFFVLVIETLVIVPAAVFTILNILNGNHYQTYHPELAGIVAYHFLLPIFVYQVIWLISNIISGVAVHATIPYIFLLTLLVPFFGLVVSVVILVPSVDHILTQNFDVSGFFLGFTCVLLVFVIAMILFTIARFSTFRKMMKKKKVVQTTTEKTPENVESAAPDPPAPIRIKDPDEISITFSRRSTMSMNDELYIPPPRR